MIRRDEPPHPIFLGLCQTVFDRYFFLSMIAVSLVMHTALPGTILAQDDEFTPGLIATFEQPDKPQFYRVDPQVVLEMRAIPPDRRLKAEPFKVTWKGMLETEGKGTYRFSAFFSGQLTIQLNGKSVLTGTQERSGWLVAPPIELPYDFLDFQIEYRAATASGDLRVFWSGPNFSLEPVPARVLFHSSSSTVENGFARGAELVREMRCAACHRVPGESTPLAAPSLKYARDLLSPQWIRDRLQETDNDHPTFDASDRKMPHYGLTSTQAEDIVAFLWSNSVDLPAPKFRWKKAKPPDKKKNNKQAENRITPQKLGHTLVRTLGCLACHRSGESGHAGPFAGPSLDGLESKRPDSFFVRWLGDPDSTQAFHRMPRFDLTKQEATAISAWLTRGLGTASTDKRNWVPSQHADRIESGRKLFRDLNCAACHRDEHQAEVVSKTNGLDFSKSDSCLNRAKPKGVRFLLAERDQEALRTYIRTASLETPSTLSAEQLLAENHCFSCHRRGSNPGLATIAAVVAQQDPTLAAIVPAMAPPTLISVGDKFTDTALNDEILRTHSPRRPYLHVRMPVFSFTAKQTKAIVHYFSSHDRIPDGYPIPQSKPIADIDSLSLHTAGARLLTSAGFGCTSCHAVGSSKPPAAPLHTLGPDLALPKNRLRKSWFDRWVRNPSRIVPRMEMPAVKIAVHGVLEDNLDQQLAAVWQVLNDPNFKPPLPNPVRIVRQSGTDNQPAPRSVFITDVVNTDDLIFLKPLLIGLPNRHNILFDLATGQMQFWTTGDVARQRVQGKSWYWELGGTVAFQGDPVTPEIELRRGESKLPPIKAGQFVTEFDTIEHDSATGGLVVTHRLRFDVPNQKTAVVKVTQSWTTPNDGSFSQGFDRVLSFDAVPAGWKVHLRPFPGPGSMQTIQQEKGFSLSGAANRRVTYSANVPHQATSDGWLLSNSGISLHYRSNMQVDRFPYIAPEPIILQPTKLEVLPGFDVTRLAFPQEIMPTALAWKPDHTLVFSSLKGRVWMAQDRNGDTLEETLWPATDELAAPFGLHAETDYVDVINKYALLRMTDLDRDGRFDRYVTLASGWGHTTDYHDWAIGLPRDEQGRYYVAFACQQDVRSEVQARFRGTVTRLTPKAPTHEDPHRYAIETISAGHRFPIGMARSHNGELFVTDNQGNYNPFNELNHVRLGKRYGFYNALEKTRGTQFPTEPPAIKLPHPWTRSVNGICFLESDKPGLFGPFRGDLIGCEMNERQLIRMSLEKVDGVFQGAAYPFTQRVKNANQGLLGPLSCAISPRGDLYLGCLLDSGWGGGNNIGSIVQCRPRPHGHSPGIDEIRITPVGFEIRFNSAINATRAAKLEHYSVTSFTRISTPAYGGDDHNRKVETVQSVRLAADRKRVFLEFANQPRPDYVYEFHLRNLAEKGQEFFPDEAYYTVLKVPQENDD